MPRSIPHMLRHPDAVQWMDSTISEAASHLSVRMARTIQEIVDAPPADVTVIPSKLVFDIKRDSGGEIVKYKTRVTARGDRQEIGFYEDTFSPVAGDISLYLVLNVAIQYDLHLLTQVDVKTPFINSPLEQEIWIYLPVGFDVKVLRDIRVSLGGGADCSKANFLPNNTQIYTKLCKSLYGLKQANRNWYALQDAFIMRFDPRFIRSYMDTCLYIIWTPHAAQSVGISLC